MAVTSQVTQLCGRSCDSGRGLQGGGAGQHHGHRPTRPGLDCEPGTGSLEVEEPSFELGLEADLGAGLGADVGAGLEPGLGAGLEADLGAGLEVDLGAGLEAVLGAGLDSPPHRCDETQTQVAFRAQGPSGRSHLKRKEQTKQWVRSA